MITAISTRSHPIRSSILNVLATTAMLVAALAVSVGGQGAPAGASPVAGSAVALLGTHDGRGYLAVTSAGVVRPFGDAQFYGSMAGTTLAKPVVGAAQTASGHGYWLVASDGGIFAFGDAPFYGSMGGSHLNQPIVGMTSTADGRGYWLVARDGGLFAYGDAGFHGSMGGSHLNQPIVGMASTPSGQGYWLVASDGGIFAYGDAQFYGSTGNLRLQAPITAMAASADGRGYWLVAADGGIFAYGDAPFYGSMGGKPLPSAITTIAATPSGHGYWMLGGSGAVFAFGDAGFYGALVNGGSTVNVVVLGDSISTQAASSFLGDMGAVSNATVNTTYASFPGTAPCDWFTSQSGRTTVSALAASRPDVAVIEFLGNSGNPCIAPANSTPTGVATQYTADLTTTINAFLNAGVGHVIVVGGPVVASNAIFDPEAINGLIKTTEHNLVVHYNSPAVTWVDAGASVETPNGGYTTTLPCTNAEIFFKLCPGAGVQEAVRAPDGIHLCAPNMFFTCTGYSSGAARFGGTEARAVDQIYGLAPLPLVP